MQLASLLYAAQVGQAQSLPFFSIFSVPRIAFVQSYRGVVFGRCEHLSLAGPKVLPL